MPEDLSARFDFERLTRRIDAPETDKAIVILVGHDRQVETAAAGVRSEVELFWVLHHVLSELAAAILPTFTPQQRQNGIPIVLPTLEQARDLGLVKPLRRNGN